MDGQNSVVDGVFPINVSTNVTGNCLTQSSCPSQAWNNLPMSGFWGLHDTHMAGVPEGFDELTLKWAPELPWT